MLLAPPFQSSVKGTHNARIRGLRHVLGWLQAQPGTTWQQRWDASGAEAMPNRTWHSATIAWWAAQGTNAVYSDVSTALSLLIASGTLRPSYRFLLARSSTFLAQTMAESRDPAGFAQLAQTMRDSPFLSTKNTGLPGRIAAIMAVKGGMVADITVGDCLQLWEVRSDSPPKSMAGAHFYELLREAGMLPANAPMYLRLFAPKGQLSPEALIDRYHIAYQPIRDLLVDYIRERQPSLDYSTLTQIASTLGLFFWKDLEIHHPGIDSLDLAPDVLAAWKLRAMTKSVVTVTDNGDVVEERVPRKAAKEKLHMVRAFYLDLAHWAMEDPKWAAWAAPCPIRPADVEQYKDKKHRKSRMDQRTRERLPVLPILIRSVTRRLADAVALLAAAGAAEPGECFTAAGVTLRRSVVANSRRQIMWAEPVDGGPRRDLGREEDRAFWTWATVEILRHTGVRAEELLELSHHSFIQYRLPSTGELVPLLQIAPSKTDSERLFLISPELADVLAAVVQRVRVPGDGVPLVISYDSGERVWNPPLPLLFQRPYAGENRSVGGHLIRDLLGAALADTGLLDASGEPLRFTPHDFRRVFITDAIMAGLPPHIAQVIAGHADINTTMGYKAVYPEEAITAHRAFIARRRQTRPSEEYRAVSDAEWETFLGHFEKRKVSLGTCGRAYDTPCNHEHACIRCPMLRPDPEQRGRLAEIRDNLVDRIAEAEREGWLGEVEGLTISLAAADGKLQQLDDLAARKSIVSLGMPGTAR